MFENTVNDLAATVKLSSAIAVFSYNRLAIIGPTRITIDCALDCYVILTAVEL